MKRIGLIILVTVFILHFYSSLAMAKQQKILLTAYASSTYFDVRLYGPDKAVDDEALTFWIGGRNASPWWIMFDTGDINQINKIVIKWMGSTFYSYAPLDYDIQISSDGNNWENIFTGISGVAGIRGETREINCQTRYIRLYIHKVRFDFPIIREFEVYSEIKLPRIIRFQAKLGNSLEAPVDGIFTLTFRLYTTETEGEPLWEEVQQNINVENGILDVELGSVTPLDLTFDKQYWLGVEVDSDGEMTPRFKLTSVPYAFTSEQ
jgi:hypothetical protein